jgi:hypothetical protein
MAREKQHQRLTLFDSRAFAKLSVRELIGKIGRGVESEEKYLKKKKHSQTLKREFVFRFICILMRMH